MNNDNGVVCCKSQWKKQTYSAGKDDGKQRREHGNSHLRGDYL